MLSDEEKQELEALRLEVAQLREQQAQPPPAPLTKQAVDSISAANGASMQSDINLSKYQVERFARHITLASFGPKAQERLCKGSALIVGAGGLGCPCALYLAGAGLQTLGIVDKDTVSLDNLHRQIGHSEGRVGTHKTDSLVTACRAVNSTTNFVPFKDGLTPRNAVHICSRFDVVIDCSDNAPTRYLVNDACVMAGKPLVSGAAVGTDGQLTVYHHKGGPCYRCLFPECPTPQNCSRCEDAGVLGPVPGVIGTLQALEAIKLLADAGDSLSGKLLLWDALANRFSTVKLRRARAECEACAPHSHLRAVGGPAAYDYDHFTGGQTLREAAPAVHVLGERRRVSPRQLRELMEEKEGGGVVVLDVRSAAHFATARLPGAVNVPLSEMDKRSPELESLLQGGQVVVVCRRGNDSQLAVQKLDALGWTGMRDLKGGLHAWALSEDLTMPTI